MWGTRVTPDFHEALFLWLCNAGALEITRNSIQSLLLVDPAIERRIVIVALDAASAVGAAACAPRATILTAAEICGHLSALSTTADYHDFNSDYFNRVSAARYDAIAYLLETRHRPVIYCDGDLVFLKDPSAYLATTSDLADGCVYVQHDGKPPPSQADLARVFRPGYRSKHAPYCTGFSVWSPREDHVALALHTARAIERIAYAKNDQDVLNDFSWWRLRRCQLLRRDLFPNGALVFKRAIAARPMSERNNTVLVHANWMVGMANKISALKEEGYWCLSGADDERTH